MHTVWPAFVISALLAVVVVALSQAYYGGYLCMFLGHVWDLEPPWSGKELRHNPACERCGHEPEEVAITGSHGGEHRV